MHSLTAVVALSFVVAIGCGGGEGGRGGEPGGPTDGVRSPDEAAGTNEMAQPEPPPADCVREGSSGSVRTPLSYSYRTFVPEAGGLYDEDIFGAVHWSSGENRITEDRRDGRWGHVELPEPVTHPRAAGVQLRSVPVMPPVHRRFVQLSAEETHRWARAERDRVMAIDGIDDPPRVLLGEQGLWNDAEGRPLTDAEIAALEPVTHEPPVGGHYRRVVNLARRLRRLGELDAPAAVLAQERDRLRDAVAGLFTHVSEMDLPDDVRDHALASCASAASRE